MKAALIEQGFKPRNPKENQLVMWEFAERAEMERVLRTHGLERDDKELHRKHLSVEEYKVRRETEKMNHCMRELMRTDSSDSSADFVSSLQDQIAESRQRIIELETERQSPYKAFYYASADKQAWIQQQLDKQNIPYRETENGFEAPDCYAKLIRRIEKDYKASRSSVRDRMRDEIDKMLMQSRSFDELLQRMKKANYKIKHVKYIAVQPPDCGTFIRLKSLGEFYSETALRNRLKAKNAYENKIAQQIQEAQATNAPNLVVLKTMRFYMISFSGGYMPIRKKNPQHILTWENDTELDKLTALNAKINEGATLNSLRADMAEKEEAVRRIEQTWDDCDNSDQYTIMKLNASLLLAEKELREAADLLTTAEQVLGGTFLQTVADEERNRKESKYVPNGTKPGGNAR